ncbi:MAG: 4-amino-4-deoxychorismate lyase, partial [Clostridium sp.]
MRKIINNEGKLDLDSGIFFGAGVFETILVKEEAKFLDYHFSRLDKGLIRLGLKPLYEKEEVLKYIESLNITNKALKITVTEKNI